MAAADKASKDAEKDARKDAHEAEKDTAKQEREANKAQRKSEKPEEAESDDTQQSEELMEPELEQGFRGTEVDMTDDQSVYTVTGDSTKAPEAQADPYKAMQEATNPEVAGR